MRIASVSDLHIDYAENRELLVSLCMEILKQKPDVIVCAGDISHDDGRISRTLTALRAIAPEVLYVPGNHELWRREGDTFERYRVHLAKLARDAGAHYLPASPFVARGVAFVGTCGWYDYSFKADWLKLPEEVYRAKQLDGLAWSDANRVHFQVDGRPLSDAEVARQMERELAEQLEEVEARADVRDVVVVTHHLAFEASVFRVGRRPWDFFNAFMGSSALGDVIRRGRRVRVAIHGHTHVVGDREVQGVRVFGTPLGYPRERAGLSQEDVLRTRIGWIELD
ncbi:MAG: metallophosphoesterase family protein [Deltaproteobacteria bacterium]|nr:metallophosphoesterase family protein [Deltaproteobacteria bacterium]